MSGWVEIKFQFQTSQDPCTLKKSFLKFLSENEIGNVIESYYDGLTAELGADAAEADISSETDSLPLVVYFESSEMTAEFLKKVSLQFPEAPTFQMRELTELDMANAWSEGSVFETEKFILLSTNTEIDNRKFLIKIAPGSSFGNGQHVTTIAMLRALEKLRFSAKDRVLDVGTGCGVLLIAAGFLGAKDLTGTDLSAEIVAEARHNLSLNGITADVVVSSIVPQDRGTFDLFFANIPITALRPLIPEMLRQASVQARFVFSGFTIIDGSQFLPELNSFGLHLQSKVEESGWLSWVFTN